MAPRVKREVVRNATTPSNNIMMHFRCLSLMYKPWLFFLYTMHLSSARDKGRA